MKKLLYLFLLLPLFLTSCGSDDDKDPTAAEQAQWIVGKWMSDPNGTWAVKIYIFDAQGNFHEYLNSTQSLAKSINTSGKYRILETNKLELQYDNAGATATWEAVPFKMKDKKTFHLDNIKYYRTSSQS
ncbi:hypothetical protein [Dysgonomonas sp. 25]|uniref:hypothetical protein n=1 Tax=Dysgonomonas sp. 25 TaxID=2302933 RepID=UPI0013D2D253|nr:hypothetical protein [Dysgonomonas sp. 25]NDV69290.1 hypothetical protein [Dysgonomonas sp. 25]